MGRRRAQRGFTYLWLLFAVAGLGLLLAQAAEVWDTVARREKEAELLFVGGQFARALADYRARSPGAAKQFPERLQDLVEDRRFSEPRRHLRKLYRDPMTQGTEWGLVKSGGRIVGVHSRSEGRPLRTHFDGAFASFAGARRYAEWVFGPEQGGAVPAAGAAGAASADAVSTAPRTDEPGQPEPDTQPANPCNDAYLASLRQCVAEIPASDPARLQRCNVDAAARQAACR